jgi:putative Ca2+/H+ antiporter (TMEM165/GDT1 family)
MLGSLSIFLAAYGTVLVAELVGDKAIYTVTSLALRFRASLVLGAMATAFAGKMLAAVLLGEALREVPSQWASILSAAALFSAAAFIWFRGPESIPAEALADTARSRGIVISFASLFFTEWGDPGQISAAALTAHTNLPLATWLGGTLALMTKGGVAMVVGLKLRDRIPQRMLRTLAAASCCLLGVLALYETAFP